MASREKTFSSYQRVVVIPFWIPDLVTDIGSIWHEYVDMWKSRAQNKTDYDEKVKPDRLEKALRFLFKSGLSFLQRSLSLWTISIFFINRPQEHFEILLL